MRTERHRGVVLRALWVTVLLGALVGGGLRFLEPSSSEPVSPSPRPPKPVAETPLAGPGTLDAYVGSAACQGCHQAVYRTWAGSDHAHAMDDARADTVLGNFEAGPLKIGSQQVTFLQEVTADGGTAFWMDITEGDNPTVDPPVRHRVTHVVGWRPLQQYLTRLGGGRLQVLPASWDVSRRRWIYAGTAEPQGKGMPSIGGAPRTTGTPTALTVTQRVIARVLTRPRWPTTAAIRNRGSGVKAATGQALAMCSDM